MIFKIEIEIIGFIKKNIGKDFIWGLTDCNPLCMQIFDIMKDTNIANEIIGKYRNEKEANKFVIEYKRNWFDLFKSVGCKEVEIGFIQNGDFVFMRDIQKKYIRVHVAFDGKLFSSSEDKGVNFFKIDFLKNKTFKVFRLI